MDLKLLKNFGGVYSETTAARQALEVLGVTAEQTGKPLSEAMIFGISSGIGFHVEINEYEGYDPTFRVSVSHRFKSRPGQYMDGLLKRIGIESTIKMTRRIAEADQTLNQAISENKPIIVYPDRSHLPWAIDDSEFEDHALVVLGYNEKSGELIIADQTDHLMSIPPADLSSARAALEVTSNRSTVLSPMSGQVDLENAIERGIKHCFEKMLNPPQPKNSQGIQGIKAMAIMIVNQKGKRGWGRIFPAGSGMLVGFQGLYNWISARGGGGNALRGLFSEFCDEAAEVLGKRDYARAGDIYRKSASLWAELADLALPAGDGLFGEARSLIDKKENFFLNPKDDTTELLAWHERQFELLDIANEDFPLSAEDIIALTAKMSMVLEEIAALEEEGAMQLKEALI